MKKILNLITISTLTAVLPTPLLSNISLIENVKQDVGKTNSNNEYVPLKEISGFGKYKILSLKFSKNNDLYFGIYADGAYKMTTGSDTPTKINGISGTIRSIFIDKYDNIYFAGKGAYKMTTGSDTPIKINAVGDSISSTVIDNSNNLYFVKKNGLYTLQTALSWTKEQSQFNLIDSTKKKTWTRNDLLTVDGELNIAIKNNNIDKVIFDNVLQPQTAKQWNINVKPETSEKDHNLQVIFTLDGKQYTNEIIVSMQAKIDPPKPSVKENLNDLIKTTDLGNIIDNSDNTIFSAVNQKNSNVIDDFSQIEITDKKDNQATLTAKKDSKSYQGSVVIKYNVVPATVVDLQIDLQPTSPDAIVVKDYVGQIDKTIITNQVNSFYYANSESKITMKKPTASSVITGIVYGVDNNWNKTPTSENKTINPTNGIVLDGSQLSTNNGKYVIELQDNLGNQNKIYLQMLNYTCKCK